MSFIWDFYVKPLSTYDILWEKQLERELFLFGFPNYQPFTTKTTHVDKHVSKQQPMMKSLSFPCLGGNSVVVVAFGWMSATKAAMHETATWLGKKKLGGGFLFLLLFGDGFLRFLFLNSTFTMWWFHVYFMFTSIWGRFPF